MHTLTPYSSRTIVQDSLTDLVDILDKTDGIKWSVDFVEVNSHYYLLQSVVHRNDGTREQTVQLWIQRNPFLSLIHI